MGKAGDSSYLKELLRAKPSKAKRNLYMQKQQHKPCSIFFLNKLPLGKAGDSSYLKGHLKNQNDLENEPYPRVLFLKKKAFFL